MTPEQRKHFEFVRDEMHGEPKQEQGEPVAYTNGKEVILAKHWTADYPPEGWEPLGYTSPQQRTWVGLTDKERVELWNQYKPLHGISEFIRSVEAELKEKNTHNT